MTTVVTPQELHARYRNTFGRVGGYLPRNPAAIDEFHKGLTRRAADLKEELHPAVQELADTLRSDGVLRMYVQNMLREVPQEHRHIHTVDELIQYLNVIVTWAPSYDRDPLKQIFLPMSALFGYIRLTPSGNVAFRNQAFGEKLHGILKAWCAYLDSPESAHVLNTRDWFSQSAIELNRLSEYECWNHRDKEHWGFTSFNDFFHRPIQDEFRPLAGNGDPSVIVAPNDGTVYNIQRNVPRSADFWLKGQPYSLENMVYGPQCKDEYVSAFVGGDVYQAFLSVNSFHRWNVPVDGTIEHLEIVPGYPFSHVESASPDPIAYTHSQGYQAHVSTRGLAFIRTGSELGNRLVCAVVIGMEEVSSISWNPEIKVGAPVARGQELGWFSYGGSSMALVFQPGVVDEFTVPFNNPDQHPDDGPTVFVKSQIARAR
ncbi:phosphatidylserine decarboxylase family protein [Streptomyces sp. CBMA152]|uniref:phosphatidylserine decarboxylase family protein n=1 Tax=Streptomyces sp. CBMA152 TaxID=1896312 RepID=UPI0016603FEA|nr:phosphatidylserine decarboxylase family protein [Streptomyces sp. CBMA152]MBD0741341.1 hypothetical protein [Streptomyces sp. CBMA152]